MGLKDLLQDEAEYYLGDISQEVQNLDLTPEQVKETRKIGRRLLEMSAVIPTRGEPFTPPPPPNAK